MRARRGRLAGSAARREGRPRPDRATWAMRGGGSAAFCRHPVGSSRRSCRSAATSCAGRSDRSRCRFAPGSAWELRRDAPARGRAGWTRQSARPGSTPTRVAASQIRRPSGGGTATPAPDVPRREPCRASDQQRGGHEPGHEYVDEQRDEHHDQSQAEKLPAPRPPRSLPTFPRGHLLSARPWRLRSGRPRRNQRIASSIGAARPSRSDSRSSRGRWSVSELAKQPGLVPATVRRPGNLLPLLMGEGWGACAEPVEVRVIRCHPDGPSIVKPIGGHSTKRRRRPPGRCSPRRRPWSPC